MLCLREQGPLTPCIARAFGAPVEVEVLRQALVQASAHERRLLGLSRPRRALLREVTLRCDGLPRVFARSILPVTIFRGAARQLRRVGSRPLGDRLFRLTGMRRQSLTLREVRRGAPLHDAARRVSRRPCAVLWARESVFGQRQRRLLVTEVFLPDFAG